MKRHTKDGTVISSKSFAGPPRYFGRQGRHSAVHFTRALPLPPPFSIYQIQPRTKLWLSYLPWQHWFADRARLRITPQTQILGRSTNVCHVWPNHFRFVWFKSLLGIRSPWNRHIDKVFWTSLILSSAIIGNFAEAIPIRLKVPFLLRGKSFNILPSCRGTTLVFRINMCICLFNLKNSTKTHFLHNRWKKNVPPTCIFQI